VKGFWIQKHPKFLCILFLSSLLCSTSLTFAQTNLASYTPGATYWGRSNYTEYIAGNLPLIISAPHGGDLSPSELPNRTNTSTYTVTTDSDLYTDNLARAIRTAAFNRYGRYPHVIICDVSRTKVDCNREIIEGAQNNTNTQTLWREFHAFLDIARQQVSNNYGRGLYIDLHGHGHAIQRNEIGYNLSDSLLFKPTLSSSDDNNSTIYALSVRSRQNFNDLVRGNLSLGALLEKRGYPCIPSPANPNPGTNSAGVTNNYFNGGYNVETYGTSSANGGTIDAIQIECNYTNVRAKSSFSSDSENAVVRATYASNLVASLDEYFKYHLEMTLDTQATPPASVNSFSDKTILEDLWVGGNAPWKNWA
jgi:N-formylglutamate amidohydrolase